MFPRLSDPDGSSSLLKAMQWIEGVVLGTPATAVAVIAVAAIGAVMLTGRFNLRRSLSAMLGCFILFGAPTIAAGIQTILSGDRTLMPALASELPPPPSTAEQTSPTSTPYDPYGGASAQ